MSEPRKTRDPRQKRSIDKKEKIVDAAYTVFCEKGYYKTTTIDVARQAGVSVGTLYSYFKDKNDLFTVILDRYEREFDALRERALEPGDGRPRTYPEMIRAVIVALLEEHEASRELNREIKILAYSDPAIAARGERQAAKILEAVRSNLEEHREDLRPTDLDAAAFVVWKSISGVVDSFTFEPQTIGRQRIIDATVDALCRYLLKASDRY